MHAVRVAFVPGKQEPVTPTFLQFCFNLYSEASKKYKLVITYFTDPTLCMISTNTDY